MIEMHPGYVAQTVRAIAVCALPAADQIDWLNSLGLGEALYADEITSELGEAVLRLPTLVNASWLSKDVVPMLTEIDSIIAGHSGREDDPFWQVDQLATNSDWRAIRLLAKSALAAI